MKHVFTALVLTFAISIANAATSKIVICPTVINCKGTPDSCYIVTPKNFDGNFVYDTNSAGYYDECEEHLPNPNGTYIWTGAMDVQIGAHGRPGAQLCKYKYDSGSNDLHRAKQICYRNKIPMIHSYTGTNWKKDNMSNFTRFRCTAATPNHCTFVIKP